MKKILNSTKFITIVSFVGLYLITAGIAWAIFSSRGGGTGTKTQLTTSGLDGARSRLDSDLPKTEECPLNGQKFTKVEKDIWEARRPITAIIENHADSRPPSGLSKSDIIYEAVAEGGITRFLNVFYCGVAAKDVRIGPVRSARIYFINWAAEYGDSPLFVHVGGANTICKNCPGGVKPRGDVAKEVDAFSALNTLGWRGAQGNALDGGTNVGYPVMWRDPERIPGAAMEHTFMGSTDKLFEEAQKRGFAAKNSTDEMWNENFTAWKFADGKPATTANAKEISFEFWSNKPDYDVKWTYDAANNRYLRQNGGKPHTDMEVDNEQLMAYNVVIMFLVEKGPMDRELHMFYQNIGRGEALIFQNGTVIKGTWEKKTQTSRTLFYDDSGDEIPFVRGKIWIEGVPEGNTIDYN